MTRRSKQDGVRQRGQRTCRLSREGQRRATRNERTKAAHPREPHQKPTTAQSFVQGWADTIGEGGGRRRRQAASPASSKPSCVAPMTVDEWPAAGGGWTGEGRATVESSPLPLVLLLLLCCCQRNPGPHWPTRAVGLLLWAAAVGARPLQNPKLGPARSFRVGVDAAAVCTLPSNAAPLEAAQKRQPTSSKYQLLTCQMAEYKQ